MPEPVHKGQLISTVYATPLMTPTTALGLSIHLSMLELRETGDWDIFLGPPERTMAETGGADKWVLKRRECSGFARVNKVTSASLGYPLSVFNKNSTETTLKAIFIHSRVIQRRASYRRMCCLDYLCELSVRVRPCKRSQYTMRAAATHFSSWNMPTRTGNTTKRACKLECPSPVGCSCTSSDSVSSTRLHKTCLDMPHE